MYPLFQQQNRHFVSVEPDALVAAVARHHGITFKAIFEKTKKRKIIEPRQMAMLLIKRKTNMHNKDIGAYFGGYDRTTVRHGIQAAQDRIDTEPPVDRLWRHLEHKFGIGAEA